MVQLLEVIHQRCGTPISTATIIIPTIIIAITAIIPITIIAITATTATKRNFGAASTGGLLFHVIESRRSRTMKQLGVTSAVQGGGKRRVEEGIRRYSRVEARQKKSRPSERP